MEIPVEAICSLGVGGALAIIIFLMYRRDRKTSEDRWIDYIEQQRQDRRFMEDRMDKIIARDQDSREKATEASKEHTEAIKEMTSVLRRLNGKSS